MSSPHVTSKLKRTDAEIKAGRPWRAKEIFQGSLSDPEYALDPEFLEAYGILLDTLGDRFESGKYLFLSGRRKPSYREPIELFWHRNRNAHIKSIITLFPRAIHKHGLGNLPQIVRDELRARGVDSDLLNRRQPSLFPEPTQRKRDLILGATIAILLAIVFSIGTVTILGWLF